MSISISNIGHAFATAAHDIKAGFLAVEHFVLKNGGTIEKDLQIVEGVSAFIPGVGPVAAALARAGEASFGVLCQAITDVNHEVKDAPGDTLTMTVNIAKDVYADLLKVIPAIKAAVVTTSTAAPVQAPSGLPVAK